MFGVAVSHELTKIITDCPHFETLYNNWNIFVEVKEWSWAL